MEEELKVTLTAYLDQRAAEDELFSASYAKTTKNLDECAKYVIGEVLKGVEKKSGTVGRFVKDEEVYSMAVHYYDEDVQKVGELPKNMSTSPSRACQTVELTDEEKEEARKRALEREIEKQRDLLHKPKAKKVEQEVLPSLFD